MNRMSSRTLPGGQTESTVYDKAGRIVAATDFAGKVTTYEYDTKNRLQQKNLPDGQSWVYGHQGDSDLVVGVSPQSLMEVGPQIYTSYDLSGNRSGVNFTMRSGTYTAPPPGGLQYTYDAARRLSSIKDPTGALTALAYDAAGNRTQIVQGNAATANLTYNTRNQPVQITVTNAGQELSFLAYTYDNAGQRTRASERIATEQSGTGSTYLIRTSDYVYDALGRLTQETSTETPAGAASPTKTRTVAYTYDAVGNRLSKAETVTTSTGNSRQVTSYTLDVNDRLTQEATQESINNAPLQAKTSTSYQFDANGNLTRAEREQLDVEHYVWDGSGDVVIPI